MWFWSSGILVSEQSEQDTYRGVQMIMFNIFLSAAVGNHVLVGKRAKRVRNLWGCTNVNT